MTDTKPMIVAGALYDFAGYLTTRPVPVKYGASEISGPMVDALKEWAAMRGLPLEDAAVQSWQEHITRAAGQVNTDTVSVPELWEAADDVILNEDGNVFTAGINYGPSIWGHMIQCHGNTEEEAIELRDKVLSAMLRAAQEGKK